MSLKRKLRILIADDVHEARRNMRLMVSMMEHLEVVAIASNGRQAVEMARDHRPDIVLMDINMPELDGLTAARYIFKLLPQAGCIITSAERDPGAFKAAMSMGIQEYLVKPFTVDELQAAIEAVSKRLGQAGAALAQEQELRKKNAAYLKQLADEYIKSKRTDDQAVEVFEQLVDDPNCDRRWLQALAMIYVLRLQWGRLRSLVEKIETRAKNN